MNPVEPPTTSSAEAQRATGLRTDVRRITAVVAVVAAVLVIAVILLYTIPVSTPFSAGLTATYGTPVGVTINLPAGSQVHGTFTTTNGESVALQIADAGRNVIYSTDSNYGSFSFTAGNPPYTLTATLPTSSSPETTVQVSGHYSTPLL